jgi:cell division protein FtsI (penicillin-binding protein 3)
MKKNNKFYLIIFSIIILIGLAIIGFYILVSHPYRLHRIQAYIEYYLPHTKVEKKHFQAPLVLRGKIITDDNITIASTQKIYKLIYNAKPYDKEKINLLLNKINNVIPIDIIQVKFRYFRNPTLKYKELIFGLTSKDITKIKKILSENNETKGFSFILSGEKRIYPYGDFLTPVIGVNKKTIDFKTNYTYIKGRSGLEGYYNDRLKKGENLYLNINFKMQNDLQNRVDSLKSFYKAKEVISIILNKDTFKVKAFASSNRYNPNNIKESDHNKLNINAIHYIFNANKFKNITNISHTLDTAKTSGIGLLYERTDNNKTNFLQLFKAFIPIYDNGYIASPKIAKNYLMDKINKRQIITEKLSQNLQKKANKLFKNMPGVAVTLEFKDKNQSAYIDIKPFSLNKHNYLQGFFIIDPKIIHKTGAKL